MVLIDPKTTPRQYFFKHMISAIVPRPIALASTMDKNGTPNLAPFSFFNIFGINPPTLIFSPARKGRNAGTKDTFENIKEIQEVVINIVNYDMIYQVNLCSSDYPKNIDEFIKAGLTPVESVKVRPFRVKESPVQIECKVKQIIETGSGGGAGNLIICEIIMVHIHENILNKNGFINPNKIKPVGRMGENYWCKAFGEALIEVEKPTGKPGIGFDSLPLDIRLSEILTGNDIAKIAMLEELPSEADIIKMKNKKEIKAIFNENANNITLLKKNIHLLSKEVIKKGNYKDALQILLTLY